VAQITPIRDHARSKALLCEASVFNSDAVELPSILVLASTLSSSTSATSEALHRRHVLLDVRLSNFPL
jgi:hypothetical protein